jgi:hypothetical protein
MGRIGAIVVAVAAIVATACVDLNSPKGSPAALSLLQLPELFVVHGDVMRDTLGTPVPPAVITFDGSGNPVTGFTPRFFVTDSNPILSFNSSGVITAANRVGLGHVVGQVGSVQTPAQIIAITVVPSSFKNTVTNDTLKLVIGADSASSVGSLALSVSLKGGKGAATDTGVTGAFVWYRLISAPLPSRSSSVTTYIAADNGLPSLVDTTDGTGTASRRLIVNAALLSDAALIAGKKVDSVIVEARMKYRGVDVPGSPIRFVVHVKGGFGS